MNIPLPKRQLELQRLIDRACDGLLSEAERARLNEILTSDPAAVEFHVAYMRVEGMVAWDFGQTERAAEEGGGPTEELQPRVAKLLASRATPLSLITAALVLVVIIGTLAYITVPLPNRGMRGMTTPPPKIVAQLTGLFDVEWSEDPARIANKSQLFAGQVLKLKQGVAEITFGQGAVVLLEGPATLELVDDGDGFLHAGKLTAQVPPRARGFRIDTPLAPIVDLGTQFGVVVDQGKSLEVHVFSGRIVVEPSSHVPQPVVVKSGSSLHLQRGSSAVVEQSTNPSQFVLATNMRTPPSWRAQQKILTADADLIVYYAFAQDPQQPARLANLGTAGERLDGLVTNARWASGRWTDKDALLFPGPSSRAYVELGESSARELNFPGSFSVAAWFRVVGSGGGDLPAIVTKGDHTWRMHIEARSGCLGFGSTPTEPSDLFSRTRVVDGRWHLGVAVYETDGSSGVKRLFVDGQLEATQETNLPIRATNAPVFIGENADHRGREFYGLIDEVAIFRRALSDAEIRAMHQAGIPAAPLDEKSTAAEIGNEQ